ncbi:hypothetical protein H0X48_03495 [Candidatus Dependentiae bacterium]|nr:hypothetical protein [Candidatus Dependentiae bacterium]
MKIFVLLTILSLSYVSKAVVITTEDAQKIGLLVWKNEALQKRDLLVFWNVLESFPSLGIGHCIWYLEGQSGPYTQQFPCLCTYLQNHGIALPHWLEKAKEIGAPWHSREEFLEDNQRTEELRSLLFSTIDLQTKYMVERLEERLTLIINAVSETEKARVLENIELMKSTLLGTYALVDYLNFKGDGLNSTENRKGERWGLLQVLLGMSSGVNKKTVLKVFTISAAEVLLRLIKNSDPDYNPIKFFNGWMSRLSTYCNETILNTI